MSVSLASRPLGPEPTRRARTLLEIFAETVQRSGAHRDRRVTADDDAWIIFTSGSTGRPKGVAVSHCSAAAFVEAETHLWTAHSEDRVLAGLPVGFDASCEEMWLAWRNGATLVPAPRALVRSGSELGPWLGERGVWNTYGPIEATVASTAVSVHAGEPITIGWPLRGWDVAIVDEHGERLPFGEPGELAIGGVGLARYIDAALDAERYAPLLSFDPRRLESPVSWPEGRCGRWRAEAVAEIDGYVGWVCWALA